MEVSLVIKNRVYKHFKGGLYLVVDVAKHSETGEKMVVYRSLKTGELWVRPIEMFLGYKEINGEKVRRFELYEL
jgi:hypothetical protein